MAAALLFAIALAPAAAQHTRRIEYSDLPASLQGSLSRGGITADRFPSYIRSLEADTDRRVARGEAEHVIYYALQSTRFTARPPIEPAISARRFVERLAPSERERLLADPAYVPKAGWPDAERTRVADLLHALGEPQSDARLAYFQEIVGADRGNVDALFADYVRIARFLYEKETLSPADPAGVSRLYQARPHSSDTQIEAGFGVYLAFGALHGLDAQFRARRVLIVGPGMDLAPRTDLVDAVAPQSYQPFAVADALVGLSLASIDGLRVHSVDVNPRVVRALDTLARDGVTLHLLRGISETKDQPLSDEYKAYVARLGLSIGRKTTAPPPIAADRRYLHSIVVRPELTRAMTAERLNIVTGRIVEDPFDAIVATNVLTYFDERTLGLALANIASMLRPGGYFVHNEARAGLVEAAESVGMPAVHMRSAVIGGAATAPLYDAVWLHRKDKPF